MYKFNIEGKDVLINPLVIWDGKEPITKNNFLRFLHNALALAGEYVDKELLLKSVECAGGLEKLMFGFLLEW